MYPFVVLGPINLPSYLLTVSISCCICLLWVYSKTRKNDQDLKVSLDLSLFIMIGGFIGGRLFHVFYEGYDYYRVFPLDAFRFWDGGFVYFGGWIGACLMAYFLTLLYKVSFKYWADFFAPILAFGYGLGRLACFFNGCCYGELCTLPWAIEFTYPGLPGGERHPTQLYAFSWELFVTVPILLFLTKKWGMGSGRVFSSWLVIHGIGRFIMEYFRADERGADILSLSISSWISLAMILVGSLVLVYYSRKASSR